MVGVVVALIVKVVDVVTLVVLELVALDVKLDE